eukprot:EG_transcript_7270
MVQDALSPSALSSPGSTVRKSAAMDLLPGGASAADQSLVDTLERLLRENEQLRALVERGDVAAGRQEAESAELRRLVRQALTDQQALPSPALDPGVLHHEVEGLRRAAQLQGCAAARLESQGALARAELQALQAQQAGDPADPALAAAVAALERFQAYTEDLRAQLELKGVLVRQLEESERRLCGQLAQMCQAKAGDSSTVVAATLEALRWLQDRNAELVRERDWQAALLRQVQAERGAEWPGVGDSAADLSPLADLHQQCASHLTTIEALRRGEAEVQKKLIQMTDVYALDTRTPSHDADPLRLLELLEDHVRVQVQAIQSITAIQDDPQEAYADGRVLGQRLTLLRRRVAALESELLDTQRALRDSEAGRDRLLLQFKDLQAQNVVLAQQSERYSVAVRALEKQLDLTRASLETTQGKVTELTVQYEDHLARMMANVTDLGLEVEILRDTAGNSGTAKLLACDELFKSNARSHALREKVRRFHALLQLRLTVFPAVLQKLHNCRAALSTHGPAVAAGRAAEAQLERAAEGLQGVIGSMLEVEHALNETQLLC